MPDESADDDLVLYEVDEDGVATVTLNRPERKNAWSLPMERRFFALLDEAAADPAVRVVIVTGAGRAFCPGMDVQRLEQNAQPGQSSTSRPACPCTAGGPCPSRSSRPSTEPAPASDWSRP